MDLNQVVFKNGIMTAHHTWLGALFLITTGLLFGCSIISVITMGHGSALSPICKVSYR